MHVSVDKEQQEHNVSKNNVEERRDDGTGRGLGHETDIALDIQSLVASIGGNDDTEYERLHNGKDEVLVGQRLDNFCGKIIPCELQVGRVTGNENDSLGEDKSCSDGACTKDDVHDDGCDCTTNNARHNKVTDGVNAHGC